MIEVIDTHITQVLDIRAQLSFEIYRSHLRNHAGD